MKSINFQNSEIKKEYKKLIKEKSFLIEIINNLEKEYKKIVIKDITYNENNIILIIDCDDINIVINIDLKTNQTMLINSCLPYALIYSNYSKRNFFPLGKLYTNNARSILQKNIIKHNEIYDKINSFEFITGNIKYGIIITEYKRKLNTISLVYMLLNEKEEINNILDILRQLQKVININDYEIKITSLDDNQSSLIIDKGELTKYVEYKETDNYKEKIYLENNEFYIEKTVKEKLDNDYVLVKRIGDRNEKRGKRKD